MGTREFKTLKVNERAAREGRAKVGPTAFSKCMSSALKGKKLKGKSAPARQKLFKSAVQSCKGRSHKKGSGRGAGAKRKRKK